jgi:hypothetical protein
VLKVKSLIRNISKKTDKQVNKQKNNWDRRPNYFSTGYRSAKAVSEQQQSEQAFFFPLAMKFLTTLSPQSFIDFSAILLYFAPVNFS